MCCPDVLPARKTPALVDGVGFLIFVLMGLLSARPLHAQEDISDHISESWRAVARADYTATVQHRRALVSKVLSRAESTISERLQVEAALFWLNQYARTCLLSDHVDWLSRVPKSQSWPRLEFLMSSARMEGALDDLDIEGARHAGTEAGLLRSWWIVGPFNNERGAGFGPNHGPDARFDPGEIFDGKDRKIGWRLLPLDLLDGRLFSASLLEPSQQSVAYFATTIHADDTFHGLLWVGANAGFKVFLNGHDIAADDSLRTYAPGQRVFPLRIPGGKNYLVFKSAAQDDPAVFSLRLTDRDGRRNSRWIDLNDVESMLEAQKPRPPSRPQEPLIEVMVEFEDHVLNSPDPLDIIAWTEIQGPLRTDKNERRKLADLLERIHGNLPAPAPLLLAMIGDLLDIPVRIQAERDDNRRRDLYEKALQLDPELALALTRLATHYTAVLPIPSRARHFIDRWLKLDKSSPYALWMQYNVSRGEDADPVALRKLLTQLSAIPLTRDVPLSILSELESDWKLVLLQAIETQLRSRPGQETLRTLREALLFDFARLNELRPHLEVSLKINDQNLNTLLRLARIADGQGEYESARKFYDRALEISPDHRGLLRESAEFARRRGDNELALRRLEHLVRIVPNDKETRRYFEFLDVGNVPFESEFPWNVQGILATRPAAEENPHLDAARFLHDETLLRVNPNGTRQTCRRLLIQVLTSAGAQSLSRIPLGGGQGTTVRVNSARLYRNDGSAADVDTSRSAWFGGHVEFPRLVPGDVIELEWRLDETTQSFFGNYFGLRHSFVTRPGVETRSSKLTLLLPANRRFKIRPINGAPAPVETRRDDGTSVVVFELRDLPRFRAEPAMPAMIEFAPGLEISTYVEWNEFTNWWWNLIREQYVITDAMRAKVAELTASKTTRLEKIRAVYDFVSTEIRYVAWEFGVHGYKPYKASTIFERRFGDCKDKAILINTMLAEIGITSYPVLINLDNQRPAEDLTTPLVEHFNHCIAFVPAGEGHGDLFLDGTAVFHEMELIPGGDRDARVVVVEHGTAREHTVPGIRPEEHVLEILSEFRLAEDGSAKGRIQATFGGLHGPDYRAWFETKSERLEKVEEILGMRHGKILLGDFQVSGVDSTVEPVRLEAELQVSALVNRSGDTFQLRVAYDESGLAPLVTSEERVSDLVLSLNLGERSVDRLELPAGWVMADRPKDVRLDGPFGRFVLEVGERDGKLEIRREFWLKKRRVKPEDYPAFREFIQAVDAAEKETVTLRRIEK